MKVGTVYKKKDWTAYLLTAMLTVYLLSIVWINFSGTPGFYDADMYLDVLYSIKSWEEKTIFPQNWVFGNQLNVVSTPVMSILFYGLLGDPLLPMAVSATLLGMLMLWTMDWMIRSVLRERNVRMICLVTFMALVLFYNEAVDGLKGWQLFFTMCSYYACYGITLFLAFGCYLRAEDRIDQKVLPMLLIASALSFGTGMQSLRQTVIMVMPLIAVEILRFLVTKCRGKIWKKAPAITAWRFQSAMLPD